MIKTELPRLSLLRRTFGLGWHNHRVPMRTVLTWASGFAAVVLFFIAQALVQQVEANNRATEEVAKRALGRQEETEQAFIHLLNGGTLVVGTDYMACRLKDRASTLLKDGRLP